MIDVPNPVQLAAELTIAWLSNANSRVRSEDVQAFLRSSYDAVVDLTSIAKKVERIEIDLKQFIPAVSVRKSLASKDYILSLIDGKPYRTLRRHLGAHGLTPGEYRRRYGLNFDYPMVAPTYRENRIDLAKKHGLGRKKS
ncbi:putative transcriptional regulator [Sphingomonas endophytica]|uniref:Putative transcriptional regulator n=1 Tax=Sphingomonas endophytica TaxID=869719 RepID=A0A7X0JCZ0_9SPHN|nr:MucR family transcriptional regulator [Sphingomonas endophytica]MBB6505333.1 putative transcriptional regulator [Sphingomonas endophytica]